MVSSTCAVTLQELDLIADLVDVFHRSLLSIRTLH